MNEREFRETLLENGREILIKNSVRRYGDCLAALDSMIEAVVIEANGDESYYHRFAPVVLECVRVIASQNNQVSGDRVTARGKG